MAEGVGGGEDLALVDHVDAQVLQHLCLGEVSYAALGHHRYGDDLDDLRDLVGVGHAGHAALGADIGRDPFQGHDGHGARLFGDASLIGVRYIHDHPALLHLGESELEKGGAVLEFRKVQVEGQAMTSWLGGL